MEYLNKTAVFIIIAFASTLCGAAQTTFLGDSPKPFSIKSCEFKMPKLNYTKDYSLKVRRFDTSFDLKNGKCFAQARIAISPQGDGVFTMQGLNLKGTDVYSGLYTASSVDFGKTFGAFKASSTVKRTPA